MRSLPVIFSAEKSSSRGVAGSLHLPLQHPQRQSGAADKMMVATEFKGRCNVKLG
jgi:hypothetical protein